MPEEFEKVSIRSNVDFLMAWLSVIWPFFPDPGATSMYPTLSWAQKMTCQPWWKYKVVHQSS